MRLMRSGRILLVLVLGLLLTLVPLGATIWATDGSKSITVMFRDIAMVVNGVEVRSSQGEPFIYEGRTYVPLRAVAEAMGADVKWDGDKWRVLINSKQDTVSLSDLVILNSQTSDQWSANLGVAETKMAGNTYPAALWMRTGCRYADNPCFVDLALDGKYQSLDALIGLADDGQNTTTVWVSVDDREVARFNLVPGAKPVPLKVDIKGGLRLKISATVVPYSSAKLTVAGSVAK